MLRTCIDVMTKLPFRANGVTYKVSSPAVRLRLTLPSAFSSITITKMSLRQDVLRSQSIDSYVVLDNNPDNSQAEHDSDDESYVNVVRIQSPSEIIGWLKGDCVAWDLRYHCLGHPHEHDHRRLRGEVAPRQDQFLALYI